MVDTGRDNSVLSEGLGSANSSEGRTTVSGSLEEAVIFYVEPQNQHVSVQETDAGATAHDVRNSLCHSVIE